MFKLFLLFMAKYKYISAKQYADSRGISLSAVTKQMRNERELPDVASYQKIDRHYMLKVLDTYEIKEPKK